MINADDIKKVRRDFYNKGIVLRDWCQANDVDYQAARNVLSGRCDARYGKAHLAAVKLGLKAGGK